jgi:Polyketide cyclase / dehydrase and lipid transport
MRSPTPMEARMSTTTQPHSTWSATATINRPIDEVFAFLADGTNDRKFSPRVLEITKKTDGPIGVGTVYSSAVKDAGLKSSREFELTEFEQPTKIRWTERSKNSITVPDGGYDLEPAGDGATRMTISNAFEAHGIGKVLLPLATRAAKKDADAFAGRIKAAIEAS